MKKAHELFVVCLILLDVGRFYGLKGAILNNAMTFADSDNTEFINFMKKKGEHMLNGYIDVLKKYVVFKGRSRRKEYWTFTLINIAVLICLAVAEQITGISDFAGIFSIYILAVFLPALSVTIRRLHDINRSGWWVFITIIPLIGSIILLVFMLLESTPGENRFGPCPV